MMQIEICERDETRIQQIKQKQIKTFDKYPQGKNVCVCVCVCVNNNPDINWGLLPLTEFPFPIILIDFGLSLGCDLNMSF